MTTDTLTVERDEVVEGAARRMLKRWVGSAIVNSSPVDSSLGIITECDILELIGRGGDPHTGYVADHFTPNPICASRDWSLERAAEATSAGGFRHLIVLEKDRVVGIISIRDIVRSWAKAQASRAITIQIREAMTPDFGNRRSRCDAPPSGAADG